MEFARDDERRLKNTKMRRGDIPTDDVVADLASVPGISDTSLDAALDAVKEGEMDSFMGHVKDICAHVADMEPDG